MSRYSYEITAQPTELGGGWRLQLLQDVEEVGGGEFPLPPATPAGAAIWWENLNDTQRSHSLGLDATDAPLGAYRACLLAEQYMMAESVGQAWVEQARQRLDFSR